MNKQLLPLKCFVLLLLAGTVAKGAEPVPEVLRQSGVKGGIAVWIGCSQHDEMAALARRGQFLVQAFSDAPDALRDARSKDLGPRVWVSGFDGLNIPFADNTVNLIVAQANAKVPMPEIMRVLTPRGVALIGGKKTVKPVPPEIDEWTHHLHGPSGNAVAMDTTVGPPTRLKWAADPMWSKHHNATANVNAMVSAQGRIFAICEESPVSIDPGLMPDQWNLVARDAFNGVLLWRVPIPLWGTRAWNAAHRRGRNNQPTHIGRRLVAVGDRVYVTLGYNAPVSELDASSGKVLRVFKKTRYTDAILCQNGKLILTINKGPQGASRSKPPVGKEVTVIDLAGGKVLWRKGDYAGLRSKTGDMDRINHLTMVTDRGRAFFFGDRKTLVSLSLKDGSELWTKARPLAKAHEMRYNLRVTDRCTLVIHKDVLLMAQPEPTKKFGHKKGIARIYAFDAATGKPLWNRPIAQWGWAEPPDVYVIKDELWVFDLKTFSLLALDPKSGKELRRWKTAEALDRPHHHRCYRNRSAGRFVMTSHRGIEMFDLKSGRNSLNPFVRGACQFGYLPCNGLIYSTPHPCSCFIDGKLNGILALGPGKTAAPTAAPAANRLVKGPAYGKVSAKSTTPDPGDWPTYRHDPARSGSTTLQIPSVLKTLWTATVKGHPTACVVGEGKVLLASKQTRRLHALDAQSGRAVWSRVMDGPMDSPPTIHRGTALCGERGGWVTCLRLTDGEVVWRFRAAPDERWIHVRGSLESASPVFGSVLVKDNTAYFTAGRSSYLDGGIFAYALDPETGAVKKQKQLITRGQSENASLSDILVSAGGSVFMRNRSIFGPTKAGRLFIFSRSGLLDEAWFNRAPWSLGRETKGASNRIWRSGGAGQTMEPLTGQYMVHDSKLAFSLVAASGERDRGIFKPARTGYRLNCAEVTSGAKAKLRWSTQVPVRIMAMVSGPNMLLAAGTPDIVDPKDPWSAIAGKKGGRLLTISKKNGKSLSTTALTAAPVLDGIALAGQNVFVVLKNGQIICMTRR
jgi:outer membrane protein assembly factor BamB